MLNPKYSRAKIQKVLGQLSERSSEKMSPFVMAEIGRGSPVVAVTAATHGDEEIGVHILDDLKDKLELKQGTVRFIVANPPALQLGVRFISQDLNRIYPGIEGATGEADIASRVLSLVSDADFIVDLHSTSSSTEAFAIVNKRNEETLALAERTRIRKIVLISLEEGHAMIDFVRCGIGIELGLHGSQYAYDAGINGLERLLGNLGLVANEQSEAVGDHEYFEIIGSILRPSFASIHLNPSFQNFHFVRKGEIIGQFDDKKAIIAEEDFYPLFVGERAYEEKVCLKARGITREEIVAEKE